MQSVETPSGLVYYNAAGSGDCLLFVHGFPLTNAMWRFQLLEFARDFRVLAPDLCGFGETRASKPISTMSEFADHIAEFVRALQITQPLTLVGLSMGGYIAFEFQRRHPQLLSRLVLCDTKAAADTPAAAAARYSMAEKVQSDGTASVVEAMLPKILGESSKAFRPDVVAEIRQQMEATTADGISAAQRGMAQRRDFSLELSAIRWPTLVVVGEEDTLTPPAEMQSMANAIPAAQFTTIPLAGHLSPLENPPFFNAALRKFLDS